MTKLLYIMIIAGPITPDQCVELSNIFPVDAAEIQVIRCIEYEQIPLIRMAPPHPRPKERE